jgi:hypothetical protein
MLFQKNIVTVLAITALSGCASLVNHSPNPVTISSFPDRTDFVVVNQQGKTVHKGTTPETVSLKTDAGYFKGEKYALNFQKKGFGTQSTPLNAELNDWYWGNLMFGNIFGLLIIDPLTGAMWSLPESTTVHLVPAR